MEKEIIPIREFTNFSSRSEEFFPMKWYQEMLQHRVVYHQETDTWHVFKYKDVKRVLSDYQIFSSEGNRTTIFVGSNQFQSSAIQLTNMDPPRHRKNRSLFSVAFTPRSLKEWEPRIENIAMQLVDQIPVGKTVDIVDALANPLPTFVIAELLDVPVRDRHQFKKWVDILFQPYDKQRLKAIEQEKDKAGQEYFQYIYPIVKQKRSNLSDDIISDLIRAEVDDQKFTDREVVVATMMLLGAGIETTSHMIANTFYSLLYDDPSLYSTLREDLELVPLAVEEMLRYRFHISKRERTVQQDNDLFGVKLKKGDVVIAWMSAANVDEEMFEDPLKINIYRKNNKRHLTFGTGPHICLGAPLARLEIAYALKTFLRKFSRIEPSESFQLEEHLTASAPGQSLTYLPLTAYK